MTEFDSTSSGDGGFRFMLDPRAARRQRNLSLFVVMTLAVAIIAAALSLDTRPATTNAASPLAKPAREAVQNIFPWSVKG